MSKYDDFDLDIRKSSGSGGADANSLTTAVDCYTIELTVTLWSCEATCIDCVTNDCTEGTNTCSGNTCSVCRSYCGSGCRNL